jgi:hypothetical protein
MINTRAELQTVADALTAGGVPAAVDPRDVSLPGAWVQRRTITRDLLGGGVTMRVRVWLIAPDVGMWGALELLDEMYDVAVIAGVIPNVDGTTTDVVTGPIGGMTGTFPACVFDVDCTVTPDPGPAPPPLQLFRDTAPADA